MKILKTIALILMSAQSFAMNQGSVLMIGDSHLVSQLGIKLDAKLRTKFEKVHTIGACGATAGTLYYQGTTQCGYFENKADNKPVRKLGGKVPDLREIIQKENPDLVIIELGTFYLFRNDLNRVATESRALAQAIRRDSMHARCVWITPPDMSRFRDQLPNLKSTIITAVDGLCDVIDAQNFTHYSSSTGGDGIHYTGSDSLMQAERYSEEVFNRLKY